MMLIRRLLFGEWDDDFLVVQPGERITISLGKDIITSVAAP
ncbi:MAG: hypothetical protein V3S89_15275 [Desulfobacterales bacterium]